MEELFAILLLIGVVSFGVQYNSWLQRTHGCSALTLWRVVGGIVDLFLWMVMFGADSIMKKVSLFFANYQDSKSVMHGFFMTLWLLLIGGAIMWLFSALTNRSKKN